MAESSKRAILHTASLDFDSVAAQSQVQKTVPIKGAKLGGVAVIAAPALDPGLAATGFVSAPGVVTVRVSNVTGGAIDSGAIHEAQSIIHDHIGGTFTVSFDGQGPTAALAFDISAANLKTALQGLSNITSVTVVLNSAGNYTVTFDDAGLGDVPLMTVDGALLTGGTTINVAETIKGVAGAQNVHIAVIQ